MAPHIGETVEFVERRDPPTVEGWELSPTIDRHWTWRLSAHCRAAVAALRCGRAHSLAGAPAALVVPVVAARGLASVAQSVLNIRLGRRQPLARQTRFDWSLIGAALVATEAVAAFHEYGGVAFSPLVLLPVIAPFSALQLRIWRRSMQADAGARARSDRPARTLRLARPSSLTPLRGSENERISLEFSPATFPNARYAT